MTGFRFFRLKAILRLVDPIASTITSYFSLHFPFILLVSIIDVYHATSNLFFINNRWLVNTIIPLTYIENK